MDELLKRLEGEPLSKLDRDQLRELVAMIEDTLAATESEPGATDLVLRAKLEGYALGLQTGLNAL